MTTEVKKVGATVTTPLTEVAKKPEKKEAPGAATVTLVATKTLATVAEPAASSAKKPAAVVEVTKADKATNPQAEKVENKAAAVLPKKAADAPVVTKKEEPIDPFKGFRKGCLEDIKKWKEGLDACKIGLVERIATKAATALLGGEGVDEKIAKFVKDLEKATSFKALLPVVEEWHKGMMEKLPIVEKAFSKERFAKVKEALVLFDKKLVVIKEALPKPIK